MLCGSLCVTLHAMKLPPLAPPSVQASALRALPADAAPQEGDMCLCQLKALSGEAVAKIYAPTESPWLAVAPFGRLCRQWNIQVFHLLLQGEVICPRPRLSAMVPKSASLELQVILGQEPCACVRVIVGKSCLCPDNSKQPPGTAPLYEFCELRTPLMRDPNDLLLRDLILHSPRGPMAKKVREKLEALLRACPKLGKRQLAEFRGKEGLPEFGLHLLVSPDGGGLALRAKTMHHPRYVVVPVP